MSLDYEVLTMNGERNHSEHAVLAHTSNGPVLVTAHDHGDVTSILREDAPGSFVPVSGDDPYPIAIHLSAPEPGRLLYSWSYGRDATDLREREVGDVRLVD